MAEPTARDDWGTAPDEEGDLCRVCRTEADEDRPLIYPCKCSGSVRYVHAECLQEWLSRSKKRFCEICGHPYKFTKVYPSSLPSTIPAIVFVRQSALVAGRIAWRVVRICISIVSWLVILPIITMGSLRVIMAGADNFTWGSLSYGLRHAIADSYHDLNGTFVLPNGTDRQPTGRELVLNVIATNGTLDFLPSFIDRMTADGKNFVAFVFRGQIVAISVATGLIGLILLREWIAQQEWHAVPRAEEEGEVDTSLWAFRNGQAIRLTDVPQGNQGTLNRAEAGDDVGDTGDAETIIADGDQEGPAADGEDDGDLLVPGVPQIRESRFERPTLSHASIDASRRVGEGSSPISILESNAEAGPSRPPADVPEDITPRAPGLGHESPLGTSSYHDDDFFEPLDTVTSAGSAPEFTSAYRRASDPGPDGDAGPGANGTVERQFGSQGNISPALPSIAEAAAAVPEADDRPPNQTGAPAGIHLTVPQAPDSPSSPDTVGTPETGDLEYDDGAATFSTDFIRAAMVETEDLETDGDVDQETDANLELDVENEVIEIENPQFRQFEAALGMGNNGDGMEVEMVQQVMARNELEGVGQEPPLDDEDDRPLDAEDWDGIFEVVGFIGPLTGLLHNHIFVSFAMAFTLTVLVGVPVLIGKLVLSTDFIRASGDMFLMTIRSIAFVSDVVFWAVTWVINDLLAPLRLLGVGDATKFIMNSLNVTSADVVHAFNFTAHLESYSRSAIAHEASAPSYFTPNLPVVNDVADKAIDGLEWIGESAHNAYKATRLLAISIAASPDTSDQLWSLVVGYLTLSFSVIGIAVIEAANLIQLSNTFMEKARNVQTFLKVFFFMTLEIVFFPVFVGLIMDFCTLPLFGATVQQRLTRIALRPFGTLFVTWACGTVFMISFAAFLTHMRTLSRPGALYFIRDPSDPTHSPVKEIMDRPALAQLPRLAVSATMYTVVVFAACGAAPWLLQGLSGLPPFQGFLPLRTDYRPLSSIPFDILFLHLVVPPSWEVLYIPHRVRKLFILSWSYAVKRVRLVSLIFGFEPIQRPTSSWSPAVWHVADTICQFIFGAYDNRATRARVPHNDRVELATLAERRREGVFIPVDQKGAPRNEADRVRLLKQDRAARRAGRNPVNDYTIVSLPRYWRTRVYALLAFILFSASCVSAGILFVPLVIGRMATAFLFEAPVYDGYSWTIGVYMCIISYLMGQSAKKHIIDASRAERLRRSQKSTRVKRWLLGVARAVYAVLMVYLVVPLLVGVNFELFISMPARYGFSSDVTPVLHVWDAWASGVAMISLYVGGVGLAGDEVAPRWPTFGDAFKRPLKQKFSYVTGVSIPVIGYLLLPIVLPWLAFVSLRSLLGFLGVPLPQVDNGWAFRMMYPLTTTALIGFMSWHAISGLAVRVRQWMIDAEYVVEERVENYEPNADPARVDGREGNVQGGMFGIVDGAEAQEPEEEWEDVAVLE